jgi:hypothetical protein
MSELEFPHPATRWVFLTTRRNFLRVLQAIKIARQQWISLSTASDVGDVAQKKS